MMGKMGDFNGAAGGNEDDEPEVVSDCAGLNLSLSSLGFKVTRTQYVKDHILFTALVGRLPDVKMTI